MRLKKFPVGWSDIWATVALYSLFKTVHLYNLDLESPVLFREPEGKLFGYSVILHSYKGEKWFVVGAPKANSSLGNATINPGAIYKCRISPKPDRKCEEILLDNYKGNQCGSDCKEERHNQWLGVSLARQPTEDGYILACAHRWKNIFYIQSEIRPLGLCFKIPADLQPYKNSPLIPCYTEQKWKHDNNALCQAGISSFVTEDLIVMGAPGSHFWTGTVVVKNEKTNSLLFFENAEKEIQEGSYLGYAVTAGHFTYPNSTEIVGGAPQQEMTGQVYIFKQNGMNLDIIFKAKGKKLAAYFGSSVCAVDFNSDGLSDLLVGAPMHSVVREEGRVYVYLNMGLGRMKELEMELVGGNSYAARFGDAIVDLGDIDDDGCSDVAIGAPQEEDQQGAIYIYNGRKEGISSTFSQKILGQQISNKLLAFGHSISGGIDADDNGFPDIAVGAFMSDSVVLLRSRPVVIVESFLQLPPSINQTFMDCFENGKPVVCINVTVCFSNKGKKIPGYIVLLYNISADVSKRIGFPSRFKLVSDGNLKSHSGEIMLYHNFIKCHTHQVFMKENVRDIITPVEFEVTYSLGKHIVKNDSRDTFPPLQPVLQKNENKANEVRNKTHFERLCAFEDCAANLQVSGKLVLEGHHVNKSYLAVQEAKRIILNIDLFNAGDDAYSSTLNVKMPKYINFVKTVEMVEKYVICGVTEEENSTCLACSVGHLYMNSQSKVGLSFLLDTSKLTRAGRDLVITINATCENEQSLDSLHDNFVTLTLPLKYEVDVAVHGSVFPPSFLYEGTISNDAGTFSFFDSSCAYQDVSYSFQPSHGECRFDNHLKNCTELPDVTVLHQMFNFVNKFGSKELSCFRHGISCLHITCQLGDLESEQVVSIHVTMRLNYALLASDSAASTRFFTAAVASSGKKLNVVEIGEMNMTVTMEAYYNFTPKIKVAIGIITIGFLLMILTLVMIIWLLWKCGFFKRKLNDRIKKKKKNHQGNWRPISEMDDDYEMDQE
ncbi:integrin alpha-4 isoform X2 [Pristis pectinata]|uniref:integrin alpha-4 isoform X2 n=1 Tax=Pristis pectinata TaxID=685728 RepID=UPI00223E7583|nr:integrin alpha-4 isoform X2 [Pristis pectinata]